MKRIFLFLFLTFLCAILFSCFDGHEGKDKVKIVEMTIYPETGYGIVFLSDIWTDVLVFSDSDDNQTQILSYTITEGFDFDYERGYEYTFKANKVWMNNPPMDVSSIKYQFVGPLTKKKVIIENSEETIELFVSSETVRYARNYPPEYENERPKIYDALRVKDTNTDNWSILKEIEGFNYESGYEYTLSVKKVIQAEPYLVQYVLLDTKDKRKK